jgi:hypothetical protein
MVNSGYLANPVSQSLSVASRGSATLDLTVPSYMRTVTEKNNKNNPKNTNEQQLFFERPRGKKSGVAGNQVLTAIRQLIVGHPLTVRSPYARKRVKLDNEHWYDHVPKSIETSHEVKVTILWNQHVQTDTTILNNKLDITICDNKKGARFLTDVAISGDRYVIKREAEKFLKYKDLIIQMQSMWNAKAKVIQ